MSLAVGIKDNLDPTVLSSSSSTGRGTSTPFGVELWAPRRPPPASPSKMATAA